MYRKKVYGFLIAALFSVVSIKSAFAGNERESDKSVKGSAVKYWETVSFVLYRLSDPENFRGTKLMDTKKFTQTNWTKMVDMYKLYSADLDLRIQELQNWKTQLGSRNQTLTSLVEAEVAEITRRKDSFDIYLMRLSEFNIDSLLELSLEEIQTKIYQLTRENEMQEKAIRAIAEAEYIQDSSRRFYAKKFVSNPSFFRLLKVDSSCLKLKGDFKIFFDYAMKDGLVLTSEGQTTRENIEKLTDPKNAFKVTCKKGTSKSVAPVIKNNELFFFMTTALAVDQNTDGLPLPWLTKERYGTTASDFVELLKKPIDLSYRPNVEEN